MAIHELLQIGKEYNVPVKTFWCDSAAEVANLPTNVPVGSICECQTKNGTTSTLTVYMLYDNGTTPEWLKI